MIKSKEGLTKMQNSHRQCFTKHSHRTEPQSPTGSKYSSEQLIPSSQNIIQRLKSKQSLLRSTQSQQQQYSTPSKSNNLSAKYSSSAKVDNYLHVKQQESLAQLSSASTTHPSIAQLQGTSIFENQLNSPSETIMNSSKYTSPTTQQLRTHLQVNPGMHYALNHQTDSYFDLQDSEVHLEIGLGSTKCRRNSIQKSTQNFFERGVVLQSNGIAKQPSLSNLSFKNLSTEGSEFQPNKFFASSSASQLFSSTTDLQNKVKKSKVFNTSDRFFTEEDTAPTQLSQKRDDNKSIKIDQRFISITDQTLNPKEQIPNIIFTGKQQLNSDSNQINNPTMFNLRSPQNSIKRPNQHPLLSQSSIGARKSLEPGTNSNVYNMEERKRSLAQGIFSSSNQQIGYASINSTATPKSHSNSKAESPSRLAKQQTSNQINMNHSQSLINVNNPNGNKVLGLAALDYQYQKQVRLQEAEIKRNRFGSEIFQMFNAEVNRLRRAFQNKQEVEPLFAHYRTSEEICAKTIEMAEKCLLFKKSRAPLESLLRKHSKTLEEYNQHPYIQLFVMIEMSKIFLEIGQPTVAIPILKFVKRSSFSNMSNLYQMKAYRQLAMAYIALSKYEIAFGYAAKYLHLSWCSDSDNNELNAYDLLGKIFYYLGDVKKSNYYHNRMAMNTRESDASNLKKMQIESHKALQRRRFEIQAAREIRKKRLKLDAFLNDSINYVSSDDEGSDLNQLIPEENKDFLLENEEEKANAKKSEQQHYLDSDREYSAHYQLHIPLRTMPKFDVKSDKGCFGEVRNQANIDIRMEQKKRESFEKFLKKPFEQFVQFKNLQGIGPMRDKFLVSHKSLNKNLQNFMQNKVNRKLKTNNIFFSSGKEQTTVPQMTGQNKFKHGMSFDAKGRPISGINGRTFTLTSEQLEENLDYEFNKEQSEFWKESMARNVEKALKKIICNIKYFNQLRSNQKEQHAKKIAEKTFFVLEPELEIPEAQLLLARINEEKYARQVINNLKQV